jgi:hypothetical protein
MAIDEDGLGPGRLYDAADDLDLLSDLNNRMAALLRCLKAAGIGRSSRRPSRR